MSGRTPPRWYDDRISLFLGAVGLLGSTAALVELARAFATCAFR